MFPLESRQGCEIGSEPCIHRTDAEKSANHSSDMAKHKSFNLSGPRVLMKSLHVSHYKTEYDGPLKF